MNITLWGNWLWHWLIGWGGMGAVVSAAAWLLWYFTPGFLGENKRIILHVAIAASIATVTSTYLAGSEYQRGVQATINAIAAKDQAMIDRVKQGQAKIDACRAMLRTWDVTTGTCQ